MSVKTETQTEVQLVRGTFTPSEAYDLMLGLIDEKINFHKLQRLRWCEGYFKADTSYADTRIAELEEEKQKVRQYIREARESGQLVRISGRVELTLDTEN
ncbi:hypothetical protein OZ410_09025 [Robiginitalea sp. M366]|uniref:hypothetical protein n=1 Tax=Robiginitalea aestuariiviva TaxID=3036903 RepID=UPI00240DD1C0|nr:hypothetical protein [Robiginitalea aestuariiviva]MDG1572456.1 hypothetical protein [Robiginitalea aestuariiviva]